MSDINLNLYKIFCTVAESKNYKEASEKLFITESTVSSHIKNLEKKLDIVLFYRERDGITLTKAGKELYDSMHEKIKEMEYAENSLIQNYDFSKSKITIGCPSHIATSYLSKYLAKVKADYPELKIDVISASDYSGLIQLLQNHIIDFVIMDIIPKEAQNEIKVETLKKSKNVFVSKEKIKIKDIKELQDYKYILNFENSTSTRELFKTLKEHNIEIKADIQSDVTEIRIGAVKQGLGIGYVMEETVLDAVKNKELYEVEIPIDLPEVKINLVYLEKYLTKMDNIFIKKYLKA